MSDSPILSPDEAAIVKLTQRLEESPSARCFGRLGSLAVLLAGWQGQVPPREISQPRAVIFAGDHGIAHRDISPHPPSWTAQAAADVEAGAGVVNALARINNVGVRLVDISVDHESSASEHVSRSTHAIDEHDAIDEDQAAHAWKIGQQLADQEIDAGADLLIPGNLSVGSRTVCAAVMAALTRLEPVVIVPPGEVIDDEQWKRKVAIIRDAMFRVRDLKDPLVITQKVGSPDIIAMASFIEQAARRRTPIILDDVEATVAAYVADCLSPGVRAWCIAAQLSPDPAHAEALNSLGLTPLLALELSAGQAAGALAALPLLNAAIELTQSEL